MFLFPQINSSQIHQVHWVHLVGPSSFQIAAEGIVGAHFYCKMAFLGQKIKIKKKGMRRRGEDVWMIRNGNGRSEKQGCSNEEKTGCHSEGTLWVRKGGPWKEEGGTGIRNGENPQLQGLAETSSEARLSRASISFLQGSQFEKQRTLMATSYLCKQAASWMWPWAPVGLERRVGLIFWVLSLPREEPAIEFHGFKKGDPFSLQAGRNVTKELEELRLHYHKVPGALKVQEKRAWLTTSGAWGFIELVMKIIFAKYSKNIW